MNNHKEPENKEKKRKDIDRQLEKSSTSEDNTAKKHDQILKQQLEEGQEIYERSIISILLSSVTAGLEIGFSYLL
ncbi:MAG: formate/nitrite transporter family protein, partial [Salegentibacter sp.]